MSYLYLASYQRSTRKFILNKHSAPGTPTACALYKTLVNFNAEKPDTDVPEEPGCVNFYIAYHPEIEFYKKHKMKVFVQYVFLRNKEQPAINLSFEEEYFLDDCFKRLEIAGDKDASGNKISLSSLKAYPVLHITSLDLFDPLLPEKDRYYKIPRYVRLLDSSIWNSYVPVIKGNSEHGFFRRLEDTIDRIIGYEGFYKLKVILENADFRARIAYNSYLSGGDHADNVVPFLFHSETEMCKRRTDNIERVKHYAAGLEWNILLIDDHAEVQLPAGLTKREVILNCLKHISDAVYEGSRATGENIFKISSAPSIRVAEEMIKENRYDIIFLDYLLGEKENGEREYGYELLRKIRGDSKRWRKRMGIYNRFWFFNISSFSHTIEERLREQGMAYHSTHWNFARGASPIITPELFLFEFSRFLIQQIDVMTELPLSKSNRKRRGWVAKGKRIITLMDLLHVIYREQDASEVPKVSVRERAAYYFDSVLTLKANYKTLQEDLGSGSKLVKSLFPDLEYYNNAFWEHLMHLVYVTAYGSVRQWAELWDEFLYIKDRLWKTEQGTLLIGLIERYIIELKGGKRQ